MILAAGLGTRLRPLTLNRPKTLMPVVNRPVIYRIIEYLKSHGITSIVVNAHHHYNQITEYLDSGRPFGIHIDVTVEPEILGTGGGIKNNEYFWNNAPFIVINGDILTNLNLQMAYEAHLSSGNLATLVLHDYSRFNQIKINSHSIITDISDKSEPGRFAFTGIHIIEPSLPDYIKKGVFSNIIDCYRELIQRGKLIGAYVVKGHYWRDIGTIKNYILVNKEMLHGNPFNVHYDSHIHSSAGLHEWAVIGEKACLEEDVEIRRSILWEGVTVKKGVKIVDSIVLMNKEVCRDLDNEIF